MSRYFKVSLSVLGIIRSQVMDELEQPNGRAEGPWRVGGDFSDGTFGYVALGDHHVTGEFAPLLDQFISIPGVEEITESQYLDAAPEEEGA